MYDYSITPKANVFLFPVSANGVAAPHILDKAIELEIPLPITIDTIIKKAG